MMRVFSIVKLVLDQKATIGATFSISLSEFALILVPVAAARVSSAIVNILARRLLHPEVLVNV